MDWDAKIVRFMFVNINSGCLVEGKLRVTCRMKLLENVVINNTLIKKGDERLFCAEALDKEDIFTSKNLAQKSSQERTIIFKSQFSRLTEV